MKKKLLVAAVMAALTVSTATAFAATAPTFSGDYQAIIQQNNDGATYTENRIRLNIDSELGDGMYAHGRIMGIDEQQRPDLYFTEAGTGSSGARVNMEQMYLGAKVGVTDVKLGRQPVYLGKGLLADINGIEGLSLNTSGDNVKFLGFAGRSDTDDVLAANLSTSATNLNMGASYLKREDSKYWGINADTKILDNVTLGGEYVKNNDFDATGFLVKATVGSAVKKGDFNYAVSYRDIDPGAIDASWTTNGAFADSKGFRVEANYKVSDNSNLLIYKDITETKSTGAHPDQIRAEFDVNF